MTADLNDNQSERSRPPEAPAGQSRQRHAEGAEESLANALRVSFRLLMVIMVFVAIAYLWTGFAGVDSTELGIKLLFGRIVGTAAPGPAYTWPFPVGEIELIDATEKALTIDDFWMHETPEDKTQTEELQKRKSQGGGLRPGWDGALLTSDRSLLHVKLICKYKVTNAEDWKKNVTNEKETIRSIVCSAAIRSAATRTADSLQRLEKAAFLNDIHRLAQAGLDRLHCGIEINAVQLAKNGITWPLGALGAFDDVTRASNAMEAAIDAARGEAEDILNAAAGPSYRKLVGEPWKPAQPGRWESPDGDDGRKRDLIGQYAAAVADGQTEQAALLLERIEEVLLTEATGEASKIIAEARARSTEIKQQAESRADRFEQVYRQLPKDPAARKLMIERLWAEVRDEVLNSPTVEKYYLRPGPGGTVLIIPRDADIAKRVRQEHLRAAEEEKPPQGGK